MSSSINVESFSKALQSELVAIVTVIDDDLVEVQKTVGQAVVDIVRGAGTFSGNDYKKSITKTPPKTKARKTTCYVWGGAEGYRLTHLLEYGHALVRGGRKVGETKPFPHFEVGQEWLENNYVEYLKRKVESR